MISSYYEKYETEIKQFRIIRRLDEGAFGTVYSAKKDNSNKNYAIKILKSKYSDADQLKRIKREIEIMISCQHPTIVKIYGFSYVDFSGENHISIIMSLAEQGSLNEVNKNSKDHKNYNNTKRQIVLIGIAYGMNVLHQHRIIHRDLKTGNVLLNSNYYPMITDFNLSKLCEKGQSMNQSMFGGTPLYMAPEIIRKDKYDFKVDVYAFGILMYEVLTGEYIFKDIINLGTQYFYSEIARGNYQPKFDNSIKKEFQKMIENCLSYDPQKRPPFAELYNKLSNINDDRFCLEGIDKNEVTDYIEMINQYNQEEDIYSLILDVENLKKQNQLIKNDISLLKSENQQLMNDRNNLIENNAELFKSNENLDKRVTKLEQIISNLLSKKNAHGGNFNNSKIEELANKLASIYQRIEVIENDLSDVKNKMSEQNIKYDHQFQLHEQKFNEIINKYRSLTQNSTNNHQSSNLMSLIEELQRKVNDLMKDNQKIKNKIKNHEQHIQQIEVKNEEIIHNYNIVIQNTNPENQNEGNNRNIEVLMATMNELQAKVQSIDKKNQLLMNQITKNKSDNHKKKKPPKNTSDINYDKIISEVNNKLKSVNNKNESFEQQMNDQKQQINQLLQLNAAVPKSNGDNEELLALINNLQNQMNSMQQKIVDQEEQIKNYDNKLAQTNEKNKNNSISSQGAENQNQINNDCNSSESKPLNKSNNRIEKTNPNENDAISQAHSYQFNNNDTNYFMNNINQNGNQLANNQNANYSSHNYPNAKGKILVYRVPKSISIIKPTPNLYSLE